MITTMLTAEDTSVTIVKGSKKKKKIFGQTQETFTGNSNTDQALNKVRSWRNTNEGSIFHEIIYFVFQASFNNDNF